MKTIEHNGQRYVAVDRDFCAPPAHMVAPLLVGSILVRDDRGEIARTMSIDVEAYGGGNDRAFHLHADNNSRRNRGAKHLTPHGTLRIHGYGSMWAIDIVCGKDDAEAGTVLLRAGLPFGEDIELMRLRRSKAEGSDVRIRNRVRGYERFLCYSPCTLAESLRIDSLLDGADLDRHPLRLYRPVEPVTGLLNEPRVNVTQDVDLPWRWGHPDHQAWMKVKFKKARE